MGNAIISAAGSGDKIAVRTYTGTGLYGSANARTLTFPFTPKAILIITFNANDDAHYVWGKQYIYSPRNGMEVTTCTVSVSGNSVTFYATASNGQGFNQLDKVYAWLALG